MLFNSWQFFFFFPAVTCAYFLLPHRFRWLLLLAASCLFYMSFIPAYILILFVTIVVDYIAGIFIEKSDGRRRKSFLVMSIVVNVGFLAFFKYFNFLNGNLAQLAQWLHWNYPLHYLSIILPIGLSFHTFQAMSYTIEVYRGRQKAERHFGIYALYVMFYPQLVAGPIERPQNLIHQFYEKHEAELARITSGLKLMLWGLFKKVVIADRLAVLVNQVYAAPREYAGIQLITATVFFAFQIYCDFSGYSDIAIGAAQVMGFRLMKNFNRPYFSKSIGEFWKRWHISLSTWFRDYVYIPLGGNRVGKWRWQYNLFITFLLSGLWHGANWTYILWGGLNGFYLVSSLWTADIRRRLAAFAGLSRLPALHACIKTGVTFALTCFAWIFFRAQNVSDAFYIVRHLFTGLGDLADPGALRRSLSAITVNRMEFFISITVMILLVGIHLVQRRGSIREMLAAQPLWLRWSVWYGLIMAVILLGYFNSNAFIYFQF
jgi:D-alanyl-lipoteichoic acid acyltransferase DltB (MBOAT superfamily)